MFLHLIIFSEEYLKTLYYTNLNFLKTSKRKTNLYYCREFVNFIIEKKLGSKINISILKKNIINNNINNIQQAPVPVLAPTPVLALTPALESTPVLALTQALESTPALAPQQQKQQQQKQFIQQLKKIEKQIEQPPALALAPAPQPQQPQPQQQVDQIVERNSKDGKWSENSIAITNTWVKGVLKPRCITRDPPPSPQQQQKQQPQQPPPQPPPSPIPPQPQPQQQPPQLIQQLQQLEKHLEQQKKLQKKLQKQKIKQQQIHQKSQQKPSANSAIYERWRGFFHGGSKYSN
ncbi:hypothetical protein ACTFIV_006412 [Dictyostelium citrinum]